MISNKILPLFENSEFASKRSSCSDTWSSYKPSGNRVDNGPIEVRHDHDIELLRSLSELHASIVDDHLFVFNSGVLLTDLSAAFKEKPISKFHDVGLVHNCDLFSASQESMLKSVLSESDGTISSNNLKTLKDSRVNLVLDAGILTLKVVPDDYEVAVLVSGIETRQIKSVDD